MAALGLGTNKAEQFHLYCVFEFARVPRTGRRRHPQILDACTKNTIVQMLGQLLDHVTVTGIRQEPILPITRQRRSPSSVGCRTNVREILFGSLTRGLIASDCTKSQLDLAAVAFGKLLHPIC
jgi:hypothetical protein